MVSYFGQLFQYIIIYWNFLFLPQISVLLSSYKKVNAPMQKKKQYSNTPLHHHQDRVYKTNTTFNSAVIKTDKQNKT